MYKNKWELLVLIVATLLLLSSVFFVLQKKHLKQKIQNAVLEKQESEEVYLQLKQKIIRCGSFSCFSGDEFVDLYEEIYPEENINKTHVVFENNEIQTYVKTIAEGLGYTPRSFINEEHLITVGEFEIPQEVWESYLQLKEHMAQEGITLSMTSGYRSFEKQKELFLNTLNLSPQETTLIPTGVYDTDIKDVLSRVAFPGYSKHHSGTALDFGCGTEVVVYNFSSTPCYEWMSYRNFARIKEYGFIPSYPEGVEYQGPHPEPWEYVWVGSEVLA